MSSPEHFNRTALLEKAASTHFDICIIGGGATGAGCALDAATRGFKVLLVEKDDFGSATSGKSTKLIHGGVRYLEQAVKKLNYGQLKMVRKALSERAILLRQAPHITRPLALITPCRTWLEGLYYYIGLKLYDAISGRTHLGKSELLSKHKALERLPTLRKNRLFSAVLYYDGQLDDLRFNWALIQTALELGAVCLNHTSVSGFKKNKQGRITDAEIQDQLGGKKFSVSASVFINATGPFADRIRLMANPALAPRLLASKGVHLLLPKHMMPSACALLIPSTADGRLLFAIPYQKHLLVGTTDEAAPLSDESFGPNAAEVQYLLHYLNDYLEIGATPLDVQAGFGGFRPLVQKVGGQTKDLVRDHEVESDTTSGLISILGGKWTTYRLMAKDTIDAAGTRLGTPKPCITHQLVLAGSRQFSHLTAIRLQQQTGWDHELVKHLVSKYGDQAELLAAMAKQVPQLRERLLPGMPYTYAELQYVVKNEMACTVKDVLCGRWGTQLADWNQTLQLIPVVGAWMSKALHWSQSEEEQYIRGYAAEVEQLMQAANS